MSGSDYADSLGLAGYTASEVRDSQKLIARDEGIQYDTDMAQEQEKDAMAKRAYERDRPGYICPIGKTGAASKRYRDGWDRIFGKAKR